MSNKYENPMFTKKGAWLWILCAPLAFVIYAHYELKNQTAKQKAKRHRKAQEHWDNWWG